MSDHHELIEEAKEKDLERRFGSWQDLDLNADGTEPDPIENIVTDACSLIARLVTALDQQGQEYADYAEHAQLDVRLSIEHLNNVETEHASALAALERERDELRAAIDGAWATTQATLRETADDGELGQELEAAQRRIERLSGICAERYDMLIRLGCDAAALAGAPAGGGEGNDHAHQD